MSQIEITGKIVSWKAQAISKYNADHIKDVLGDICEFKWKTTSMLNGLKWALGKTFNSGVLIRKAKCPVKHGVACTVVREVQGKDGNKYDEVMTFALVDLQKHNKNKEGWKLSIVYPKDTSVEPFATNLWINCRRLGRGIQNIEDYSNEYRVGMDSWEVGKQLSKVMAEGLSGVAVKKGAGVYYVPASKSKEWDRVRQTFETLKGASFSVMTMYADPDTTASLFDAATTEIKGRYDSLLDDLKNVNEGLDLSDDRDRIKADKLRQKIVEKLEQTKQVAMDVSESLKSGEFMIKEIETGMASAVARANIVASMKSLVRN